MIIQKTMKKKVIMVNSLFNFLESQRNRDAIKLKDYGKQNLIPSKNLSSRNNHDSKNSDTLQSKNLFFKYKNYFNKI